LKCAGSSAITSPRRGCDTPLRKAARSVKVSPGMNPAVNRLSSDPVRKTTSAPCSRSRSARPAQVPDGVLVEIVDLVYLPLVRGRQSVKPSR
jgi:hypothetical protein